MHAINGIFQIAAGAGVHSTHKARQKRPTHLDGISFTLSILCYVVIESPAIQSQPVLHFVAMLGAISIPVLFWFLTRAIFDDHFTFLPLMFAWLLVQLVPHFNFLICDV